MRSKARSFGLLTLVAASFILAFGASSAEAEFGIARWESLTCNSDESAPGLGNWAANGNPCVASDETSRFYTQAAGHPPFGIQAFLMNQTGGTPNLPDGFLKRSVVELPVGLGVNPLATPQCTVKQLNEPVSAGPPLLTKCSTEVPGSLIGVNYLTTLAPGPVPPEGTEVTIPALVYNIETPSDPESPYYGAPSMAGFNATGEATFLKGSLSPIDQHINFTTKPDLESPLEGGAPVIGSRLVFNGRSGQGYVTLPSHCDGPQVSIFKALSHPYPVPPGPELEVSEPFATPYDATNCEAVPFEPEISTTVDSRTDSPEPLALDLRIPFNPDPEGLTNSELKEAEVTLPEGMGINPSLANGLQPCTNEQFQYQTNNPIGCPQSSEIGTVDVETPTLPAGSLHGKVYVAEPESDNPSSGRQFRIFLTVESTRFGVNVRLRGNVFPNLQTGQVKAVVAENPQAPFSSFKIHIDGGPRGALTSPPTCGPNTTTADLAPWSENGNAHPSDSFTLTSSPSGGACPQKLGQRPFNPSFAAHPLQTQAGAFSPFQLNISRPDGAQEIRQVNADLPPGMVASLAGVPYCSETSIDAAEAASGKAEQASPSCPAASQIGEVNVAVGSGPAPYHTPGKIYLAGPYEGAPISFVFVVPAVAGPFDLGTDVVRTAVFVNPETAEVHAVSDPIPYVFGGVKLDIRGISVSINQPSFTLNPTTCRSTFLIGGNIFGGGEDPANSKEWFESRQGTPFHATNCRALKFAPRFHARIFGGRKQTQRAQHPRFRAILEARKGDANVRRAAFILPRATILDQSHIKTICTKVQLAANQCPKDSIYGHARATSPLLDKPLEGPVYLTSSTHELPDLLANLRGQVPIQLRGVISGQNARLKTVFNSTPDVPVRKFELNMKGGSKGLLVNSRNLCKSRTSGFLNLLAQNSRRVRNSNLRLNIPACRKGS